MKKILMIGICLLGSFWQVAEAQKSNQSSNYTTALGVKFYPGAVTFKHFIKEGRALEGLGYFWERGARFTLLYEFHQDINDVPGLSWYVGPGAHIGFYNRKKNLAGYGGSGLGIDGVIGLDYKINSAPINISLDWQPSFEFGDNYGNGFSGNWGGFAIRYVIK